MFDNLFENDFNRTFNNGSVTKAQVHPVKFKPLEPVTAARVKPRSIDVLDDVDVSIDVALGYTKLTVREILDLTKGSVIELNRVAGDPVDIYVNEQEFATGEIVVINDTYGVRINHLVAAEEKEE